MTRGAAKWLRLFEIVLAIAGLSLLGGAFAATASRWHYQAGRPLAAVSAGGEAPAPRLPGEAALEPALGPAAADPLDLGTIEIPRVGIEARVREGADDATLGLAVGHLPGTARPGENGNTVLAGHRDTFFRGLREVRLNDRIRLVVPPHSYEYSIVSLTVVAPTEMSVLDPTKDETLTLVTCYPFRYVGPAPRRFIVRATRVE